MITANVSGARAQTAYAQKPAPKRPASKFLTRRFTTPQISNQINPAAQNNVIFIIMRVG